MTTVVSPIILASASPRRQELLAHAGVSFSVVVPGCDETPIAGESVQQMVERLALLKARTVADVYPDAYVIGSDTTVFIDGTSLGKPSSVSEACEMLRTIQGRTHQVWGGIAIMCKSRQIAESWSHVTSVSMRPMDAAMIKEYVSSGEPMDKAGSYAIQGLGLQFVERIEGSYSNVVGLNIASVMEKLRSMSCA